MIKLIDAKGEEIKEPLAINKEVNNVYSNLYKAKDLEECEIEQLVTEIIKLSEEESRPLEGKITIEETGTALKHMKHKPWYGWFWGRIFQVLLEAAWTICS